MRSIVLRWLSVFSGKRLLLAIFRVSALTLAIIPLVLFSDDLSYITSPAFFIVMSSLYTAFKLVHPLESHKSKLSNVGLLGVDLGLTLSLVTLTGGIHSPFMLYALTPTLTAALLLPRRATAIVSGVSVVYIALLALFAPFSPMEMVEHFSLVSIYFAAIGIFAILPYAVNTTSKRLLRSAAMLQERSRLGREMHDGIYQVLYGLRWELQALSGEAQCTGHITEKLRYLGGLLDGAEEKIRSSMESLRSARDDRSLLSQIQGYLSRLENDSRMACRLEADSEPDLDEPVKIEVLDICWEALRNAAKHSKAQAVTVNVLSKNDNLQVRISDDGDGFEPIFLSGHGLTVSQ